jgi:hypothetical protein
MLAKLEDWKNGWIGIELGIHPSEINALIKMLEMIRDNPEQHFHLSSDYKAASGLGDIEIYALAAGEEHNMSLSGRALGPGGVI